MALYLIGLGLGDDRDLTVRGLEVAQRCGKVYLETYTSVLSGAAEALSARIGKELHAADRALIEQHADTVLAEAKRHDVALLVVGDPLLATTHVDLLMRAAEAGVAVEVIHNASVLSAIAETGLQLYKFGKITSIPFPEKNFTPVTPFDVFLQNQSIGAHTLFLLDLRQSEGKFLTIPQAIGILLNIAVERKSASLTPSTMAVGCARLGTKEQHIAHGSVAQLQGMDFGAPPYCLIIPAKLHFAEEEFLGQFKLSGARMQ